MRRVPSLLWSLVAILAVAGVALSAGCGTATFTAKKEAWTEYRIGRAGGSSTQTTYCDGEKVVEVRSPKAFAFRVLCDEGEVPGYLPDGTVTCEPEE